MCPDEQRPCSTVLMYVPEEALGSSGTSWGNVGLDGPGFSQIDAIAKPGILADPLPGPRRLVEFKKAFVIRVVHFLEQGERL
jgi:hypothetical protein